MPVYLDHAATTPMLPEARDAYVEALAHVGNPSSIHGHGQAARRRLEDARAAVAASLDCDPIEVIWTSGGTEAINLAIKGLFWAARAADPARIRIVVPEGEHHATVDAVAWLERHEGAVVSRVPLDVLGVVDAVAFERELDREPASIALATLLLANNEVGAVQPVRRIVRAAHARGVPVHVDAVAAYGHLPVSVRQLGADALSVSAHKIGGPVGVGALALARTATVEPLAHGGGQQRGIRSGTQDVAAASGFAAAARVATADPAGEAARLDALCARLADGIRDLVPGAVVRGPALDARLDDDGTEVRARVPGNVHATFEGCQGDSLLFLLDLAGVSVSTGSACQAGIPEPSHVLLAMGLSDESARGALRFTLGRSSTDGDVDAVLAALPDAVARARRAGYSERSVR